MHVHGQFAAQLHSSKSYGATVRSDVLQVAGAEGSEATTLSSDTFGTSQHSCGTGDLLLVDVRSAAAAA